MKDKEVEVRNYYELCYYDNGKWYCKAFPYYTEEDARFAGETTTLPFVVVAVEVTEVRNVVYRREESK